MTEHCYKDYKIILLASLQDNGLWACPYVVECEPHAQAPAPRQTPPGLWDTMDHAEAGALMHAKAWIDAQKGQSN